MTHALTLIHLIDEKSSTPAVDAVIAELAARQYGVVARFQLFAMGLKRGMIDGRIRRRTLHPIHNAVYAVGHPSITRQGHYMAAVLAGGEDAALSHRSAGMHWGITRFGGRIEITVPTPRRRRHPFVARSSSLDPDEITIHENIPITTPARTLIDLAAVVPPPKLEKAIREAEYLRLFDLDETARLLDRHRRRKGTAALRKAIQQAAEARNRTRSDLEDRFINLLSAENLPAPELNGTLELPAMTIEPDAMWRDRRLIVELDSWSAHGTQSAFELDRKRDLALAAASWLSVRITWHALDGGIPQDLRSLLAQ